MPKRLTYTFTNRRTVRNAIRLLRRNFPNQSRLDLGVVVQKDDKILVQAILRGRPKAHEEIFAQGILSGGRVVEISPDEFAQAALEAPEAYLGAAALVFPIGRPGERPGGGHGR